MKTNTLLKAVIALTIVTLVILVGLITVFLIPQAFKQPTGNIVQVEPEIDLPEVTQAPIPEYMRACQSDLDCTLTSTTCPCCGLEGINKDFEKEYIDDVYLPTCSNKLRACNCLFRNEPICLNGFCDIKNTEAIDDNGPLPPKPLSNNSLDISCKVNTDCRVITNYYEPTENIPGETTVACLSTNYKLRDGVDRIYPNDSFKDSCMCFEEACTFINDIPKEKYTLITEDEAIAIAKETVGDAMEINSQTPVTVTLEGDVVYVVIFEANVPEGTLGAEFIAKVIIDSRTGQVIDWLVGS